MTPARRRLDDTASTGLFLVGSAGALLAVASVVVTASPGGFVDVRTALAFAAFIALGELVRITLPGGRDAAPIATAGALAYTLLTRMPGEDPGHSALQVVAVTACAMLIGVAPHAVVGRAPSVDTLARRLLTIGFAAGIFRGTGLDDEVMSMRQAPLALVMVAIVVATLAVDALLAAVVRASADRAPFVAVLRNEAVAQAGIGSAIGATGALIALAATIMDIWALPVFVVPLLLTQFAFRRYAAIRESSLQTIRALSRVTELGGYTETGHSRRVSQLSMAVGRELGVVAAPADQRRIAALGADVIRQTGVPDEVSQIVNLQAEPYRRAHESQRSEIPLAARIIKAVNAYDDLVGDSYELSRQLEALERLRLGMAYEYDPTVVESLSKTVERTARLGA
jgi:hypothetical protein